MPALKPTAMRQKKPATQLSGGLRSSTRLPTSATANIEEVVATLAVLEKDQQHENADMERQQEQERNISERPKIPEKKVVCPFSQAREGAKALCDWVEHATIRSVSLQFTSRLLTNSYNNIFAKSGSGLCQDVITKCRSDSIILITRWIRSGKPKR